MMRSLLSALTAFSLTGPALADPTTIVDLSDPDRHDDWRFFTDRVMGGKSEGKAVIEDGMLTMRGTVTTANGGGFIQARLENVTLPDDTTRLVARVRGDGQVYYLHLRTEGTRLPWQYYQAPIVAPAGWSEIAVPMSSFTPSGSLMRAVPEAARVRSVALVAYGRDHEADVSLAWLRAE